MFRFLVLLTIIAATAMLFTNPPLEAHRSVVNGQLDQEATRQGFLRRVLVDAQQSAGLVPMQYDNYYVFSTVSVGGKLKTIGCFSRVWPWKWDTPKAVMPNQMPQQP